MNKHFLYIISVLYCGCLCAQPSVDDIDDLNEHLYQPVVVYQDVQTALSFTPTKSTYCLDITKGFTLNQPIKNNAAVTTASSAKKSIILYQPLTLPDTWLNREKIIYIAPQSVSFSLLVNGIEVSYIPKEFALQFNITSLLKPAENLIELKLSGSYQKGFLNTILLLSQPTLHNVNVDIRQMV